MKQGTIKEIISKSVLFSGELKYSKSCDLDIDVMMM